MNNFTIEELKAFVLRASIDEPVRTSFGVMNDRPAVLIRVVESTGIVGWGESWCNFPACGAEHRGRLLETEIAPRLIGTQIEDPQNTFNALTNELRALCNQSGEYGPIAQILAGVDVALWDIAAQKAQQPLWRFLGGTRSKVPIYASGINPNNPDNDIKSVVIYDSLNIGAKFINFNAYYCKYLHVFKNNSTT